MDPQVSVIVAAYNAARYIQGAVASALRQTVTSLEVVIVDDGSTDATLSVARGFTDPRVRVLTRANGGPAGARNEGIRAARAVRFIAFLDADDEWDPDKLARQIDFFHTHPECVVVGCLMRYVSAEGKTVGCAGHPVGPGDHERIARGELFPFPLSSFVVARRELERAGGFDEALGRPRGGSEDLDLIARLAGVGAIGCIPVPLGAYRVHAASAMARYRRVINRDARFVRARLRARRNGGDLTRAHFDQSMPDSWHERRQDVVEVCYRTAALGLAEGRLFTALLYGAIAALGNPMYTCRRVYQQRLRSTPHIAHGQR